MNESTGASAGGVPSYWKEYPERDTEYVHWYPCLVGPIAQEDVWRPREFCYYAHIPFCNDLCHSCIYNRYSTQGPLVRRYLAALAREIANYAARPHVRDGLCISGYLGGGTPTALSTEMLDELLTTIENSFRLKKGLSITVETTPATINPRKAEMLLRHGVERISMGVQTFNDELLPLLNRSHTAARVREQIEMLRRAGMPHICIDLMVGLPGQTMDSWLESIDTFVELKLESLSIYTFFLIPDDRLAGNIQRSVAPPLPSRDEIDAMYDAGVRRLLASGYFAVTANDFGKEPSGHGLEKWGPGVKVYRLGDEDFYGMIAATFPPTAHLNHTWYECGELLALGSGAYGFMKSHMYLNEPNVERYMERCEQGRLPVVAGTHVSARERMHRSMVLGSKFLKIGRRDFIDQHGVDMTQVFGAGIRRLEEQGLVRLDEETLEVLYPRGWHYMDNVSKAFYSPDNYRLPQPTPMNTNLLRWLRPAPAPPKEGEYVRP